MKTSLRSAAFAAIVLSLVAVSQQASAQTTGTSVAVIDIPYIFKNHQRFTASIEDIKKDIDQYKAFVTQEQQKMRTEAEKLEQYRPGTAEYKQIEERLARMKVELQLEGAKRQKDFMEREAKVYFNAYKEVEAAVAEFAQRNRINLVLRYSGEDMDATKRESIMQGINRFVVYQNQLNITSIILDTLNRNTAPAVGQNTPANPQIPRPQTRR